MVCMEYETNGVSVHLVPTSRMLVSCSAFFLEDGGDKFLRSFASDVDYTKLYLQKMATFITTEFGNLKSYRKCIWFYRNQILTLLVEINRIVPQLTVLSSLPQI
jgi:hypothetical protein